MTGDETNARSGVLTARSWTRSAAILPVSAVATIAACALAAGLTSGPVRLVAVPVVLLIGIAAGLLWWRARGADAIHRVVASVRGGESAAGGGASLLPDGPADPRDTALALPRGWRVESAAGRLRIAQGGAVLRAETWVLRAVVGSRRAPRRREVVGVDQTTGGVRLHFPLGIVVDSLLVTPSWAGRAEGRPEPSWAPAVRERVASHADLPASLVVGDDRVLLFALDDPRPETMRRRAQLVGDVAALIAAG